jgi:hypothetical protein
MMSARVTWMGAGPSGIGVANRGGGPSGGLCWLA